MTDLAALFLALLAGCLMPLQGSLNSYLGKNTGELEATLVNFLVGLFFLIFLVFLLGKGSLKASTQVPPYFLLGGCLGATVVFITTLTFPVIGATSVTAAIIAGQLAFASILDHFGLLGLNQIPLSPARLFGLSLLLLGAWLVLRQP